MPLRKPGAPETASKITQASQPNPLKMLHSENQEERWAAARGAANVTGGANALAKALRSEPDPRVREAMFTSLTRIHSLESVNALLPLLRSEDASLRGGALDALRAITDVVREHLPTLLNDSDVDVRILSCELARNLPGEVATSMLCNLLANEQEINVCAAAIDVLAEVGNTDALPSLEASAKRFEQMPFMEFAIRIATDRIQTGHARGSASVNPSSSAPHE